MLLLCHDFGWWKSPWKLMSRYSIVNSRNGTHCSLFFCFNWIHHIDRNEKKRKLDRKKTYQISNVKHDTYRYIIWRASSTADYTAFSSLYKAYSDKIRLSYPIVDFMLYIGSHSRIRGWVSHAIPLKFFSLGHRLSLLPVATRYQEGT